MNVTTKCKVFFEALNVYRCNSSDVNNVAVMKQRSLP
jgi:hypothetical protein